MTSVYRFAGPALLAVIGSALLNGAFTSGCYGTSGVDTGTDGSPDATGTTTAATTGTTTAATTGTTTAATTGTTTSATTGTIDRRDDRDLDRRDDRDLDRRYDDRDRRRDDNEHHNRHDDRHDNRNDGYDDRDDDRLNAWLGHACDWRSYGDRGGGHRDREPKHHRGDDRNRLSPGSASRKTHITNSTRSTATNART
jgi:hypothetical protein